MQVGGSTDRNKLSWVTASLFFCVKRILPFIFVQECNGEEIGKDVGIHTQLSI